MASHSDKPQNRFQMAVEVLQRGRDVLMQEMAEQILDRSEDFEEGGFLFQEFLENQGSKLHFLYMMISQMEQSSELFEEQNRVQTDTDQPVNDDSSSNEPPAELLAAWAEIEAREAMQATSTESAEEPRPKKRRRKSRIKSESSLTSPSDENE
ncbi:MAG: hypothetical protein ACKO5E_18435 [bacterium]